MRSILVVDDNKEVLSGLKDVLKEIFSDYEILTATNGRTAINKTKKNIPDVIILDINMPDISGYDVCKKIRNDKKLSYIPIVFLTGKETDMDSRVKGYEAGGDDFISKPVGVNELFARLKSAIRIKSLQDELMNEKLLLEKKVEERTKELLDSERRYRSIIELSPENILTLDLSGKILSANNIFFKATGYSKEEVIGKNFSQIGLFRPQDISMYLEYFSSILSGKITKEVEHRWIHKDGSFHWGETYVGLIKENNKVVGFQAIIRDITERKKNEEALKNSRAQLQELSKHLMTAREEERKAIAREIHDELGQVLTVLKMEIHWLNKRLPKDQEFLIKKSNSMLDLSTQMINTIRRIYTELRPIMLDELGLIEAIEWQINEFKNHSGIECEVNTFSKDIKIDQEQSIALFRIFQEILNNIIRHAKAKKVKISLKKENENLILDIKDDGIGITQRKIKDKKSFGLMGIRERSNYLNGKLKITGRKGKGTTVILTIPLNIEETK